MIDKMLLRKYCYPLVFLMLVIGSPLSPGKDQAKEKPGDSAGSKAVARSPLAFYQPTAEWKWMTNGR
jgi:hypothetical protein